MQQVVETDAVRLPLDQNGADDVGSHRGRDEKHSLLPSLLQLYGYKGARTKSAVVVTAAQSQEARVPRRSSSRFIHLRGR
jgi:hypothetical protein